MKKMLSIFLLFFSGLLFKACWCDNDDHCHTVTGIDLNSFSIDLDTTIQENDTIATEDLLFVIDLEGEMDFCLNTLNTGNNLYAFSCDDPNDVLRHKLTDITITSNSFINSERPPESNLEELFSVGYYGVECIDSTGMFISCFNGAGRDTWTYEQKVDAAFTTYFHYERIGLIAGSRSVFKLNNKENILPGQHQFTFTFEFEHGVRFTIETKSVVLE